jgi:hypothetical protein
MTRANPKARTWEAGLFEKFCRNADEQQGKPDPNYEKVGQPRRLIGLSPAEI